MKKIPNWTLTILCVVAPFLLLLSFIGVFGMRYNYVSLSNMLWYFPFALILAVVLFAAVIFVAIRNKQGYEPLGINLHDMQWWAKLIVLAIVAALYFYDWKSDMESTKEKQINAHVQPDNSKDTTINKSDSTTILGVTKQPNNQLEQTTSLDQNDSSGVIYQALIDNIRRKKDSLFHVLASEKSMLDVAKENKRKKQEQKNYFCTITKEEKKQIDSVAALIADVKKQRNKIIATQTADCDCSTNGVVVVVNGKKQ